MAACASRAPRMLRGGVHWAPEWSNDLVDSSWLSGTPAARRSEGDQANGGIAWQTESRPLPRQLRQRGHPPRGRPYDPGPLAMRICASGIPRQSDRSSSHQLARQLRTPRVTQASKPGTRQRQCRPLLRHGTATNGCHRKRRQSHGPLRRYRREAVCPFVTQGGKRPTRGRCASSLW